MDGTEWREGITRCPEHDVDLVDEPPEIEEEPSLLGRLELGGLARPAVAAIVVSAIVYALSGVVVSGWFALAARRQWVETGLLDALQFLQSASSAVAVGGLGCLAAGVLGRTFSRLEATTPPEDALDEASEEEDEPERAPGAIAWVVTLLSSFTVVFALVWAATGVAVAWDEAKAQTGGLAAFPGNEPSETFVNLSALHGAAYDCGLAALVCLGALLMAQAYDRMARLR